MDDKILDLKNQLEKSRKTHRNWKKIVTSLAAIVVFCTTYMLILPAITMEKETVCGKEEHVHDENCYVKITTEQKLQLDCTYDSLGVHVHSSECKDESDNVICGYADYIFHEHADMCFDADGRLICELPEEPEHIHTDECYEVINETINHVHTDDCYEIEAGELICGQKEIEENASEEDLSEENVSEEQVSEEHTHTEACYEQVQTIVCGMEEAIASDPVLVCDKADIAIHEHTEACMKSVDVPVADIEELTCGQEESEEHTHGERCYGTWTQICEKEEHTHDETCLPEETEEIEETEEETESDQEESAEESAVENDDTVSSEEGLVRPEFLDAWAETTGEAAVDAEVPMMRSFAMRSSESASTYAEGENGQLDLTGWINDVKMYRVEDGKSTEIPNGSVVEEGEWIRFKIDYTIPGQQLAYMEGKEIHFVSNTVTYQIPESFSSVEEESGIIRNSTGERVGTFTIIGKTITMVFDQTYVNENANAKQIHGYISFYSLVTKKTEDTNENQGFEFTDSKTLEFSVQESDEAIGDLKVRKDISEINGDTITFRIAVSSPQGTKGPVTLKDVMSDSLSCIENTLSVKKGIQDIAYEGDIHEMTLPPMNAGDTYIISYDAKVDADLLGQDLTVSNKATVTGTGSHGQPLEDEATVTHTFNMLEKKGEPGENSGEIVWSVTVNQAELDISGWVLTDIVGSQPYTGNADLCDKYGNKIRDIQIPYTFPEGTNDTYIIKYTTTHNVEAGGNTITNKAILKGSDEWEVEGTASTGVGSPAKKTGTTNGDAYQGTDERWRVPLTWTVTVSTEKGALPAGTVLNDRLMGYPSQDMYMTYEQVSTALANFYAAIEAAGGSVDPDKTKVTIFAEGASNYGREINWNNLSTEVANYASEWYEGFSVTLKTGISENKTMTFSYKAIGLFANNIVTNVRYANRFNINGRYEVEGKVDYFAGKVGAKKLGIVHYDPEKDNSEFDWKMDWGEYGGSPSTFDYDDLKDGYLAWAIELLVPPGYGGTGDVVLYEDLPEGVSIREMDMTSYNGVPSFTRLHLENIQPGNTYYLETNPVHYTSDGMVAKIQVEATDSGDVRITFPEVMLKAMADRIPEELKQKPDFDGWYVYFYFYTQINGNFEWTPTSESALVYKNAFENKFTVEDSNGKEIISGGHTQIIDRDEKEGNILKTAVKDKDDANVVMYQVVLNENGLNLNPNSDILPVKDILTYESSTDTYFKMQLVNNSVRLYECIALNDANIPTKGEEVDFAYQYNESAETVGDVIKRTHTIDLTIPDSKALVLEYEYKAVGVQDNQNHKLINTCTIEGAGDGGIVDDSDIEMIVSDSETSANIAGVVIKKVDFNNNRVHLPNAKFNLYVWNKEQECFVICGDQNGPWIFTTNDQGILDPDSFNDYVAYNTAYYLVEVEAPAGYYLLNEPYYFYVSNEDKTAYKPCMPTQGQLDKLENELGKEIVLNELMDGSYVELKNEIAVTEITVRKKWLNYNHDEITVTGDEVPSVTFELWQKLEGVEGSDKLYKTYTITPDADGNWKTTITDLPKGKKTTDGKKEGNELYKYYIKEVSVPKFEVVGYEYDDGDPSTTDDSDGIHSGTITMTNRETEGYELPETGGIGTTPYTTGGLLLMTVAATFLLLYKNKKHGKEDITSS